LDSTIDVITGDMIAVNTGNGYDVGRISLTGDLVSLQMKKKKFEKERIEYNVIRKANERDLEKLKDARSMEKSAMVKARAISRTLEINMKVGDVEFQGDKRKATFYYTAEGRIDFRELVRAYAKEFKVKIEMRQIGSRQESARIGGIGSCGRELCCSTWLTEFKSVSTSAARYQYMAINQSKLSGQCGRLKCCLNYELDSYVDAISGFPEKADYLKTQDGSAKLLKIDIFKGIMYYSLSSKRGRGPIIPIDKEDVKKILEMNKAGEFPASMMAIQQMSAVEKEDEFTDYEDVTGAVELPSKRKHKGKKRSNHNKSSKNSSGHKPNNKKDNSQQSSSSEKSKSPNKKSSKKRSFRKKNNKPNTDKKE
jgi:cell fate regulator YaaT (PSP1 superfamily)